MTDKTTEALKLALETAEAIAAANWKTWEELATPEEFERWAKSRANHMAAAIREALAEQGKQEPVAYTNKEQVNELIKESARLIGSIKDEGDQYLTAIDALRNAYRIGLKDSPVDAKAIREGRTKELMQLFLDPENQPTQFGTATLEYRQEEHKAIRAEALEEAAKVCDDMANNPMTGVLYSWKCAAAIRGLK